MRLPAAAATLALSCSCATQQSNENSVFVSFNDKTGQCSAKDTLSGRSFGYSIDDLKQLESAAQDWPGQQITVQASATAPYKCVGAAVYVLQRAKRQVSFVAEPAPSPAN